MNISLDSNIKIRMLEWTKNQLIFDRKVNYWFGGICEYLSISVDNTHNLKLKLFLYDLHSIAKTHFEASLDIRSHWWPKRDYNTRIEFLEFCINQLKNKDESIHHLQN